MPLFRFMCRKEIIMFGFFKRHSAVTAIETEEFEVMAPIAGTLINLEKVNDPVFAQKMMGDGFAVIPDAGVDTITAPVSGSIKMLPSSKHAVGLVTPNGIEVLVHVGLNTVELNGNGFKAYVKEGDQVSRGDRLIKFDPEIMREKGLDMTTMVIFTAGYDKTVVPLLDFDSKVDQESVLLK
jgi:sugar PTS system EIIA component